MTGRARWLRDPVLGILRLGECLVFGGRLREAMLRHALRAHYRSIVRRYWKWSPAERIPHFFDHRIDAFGCVAGYGNPDSLLRGYHTRAVMREGDTLLDIGCGDGFFDSRFYSSRCLFIDAIDIDPRAIAHSVRYHSATNIAYLVADAVLDPFPHPTYDVVVWHGAIAHLTVDGAETVLAKIARALTENGLFVGSEALRDQSVDHLQHFDSENDVVDLLKKHFPIVETRTYAYDVGGNNRAEVLWRCGTSSERTDATRYVRH